MCGLTGFYSSLIKRDSTTMMNDLQRMTSVLEHRGPDDRGVWVNQAAGIALGHQRLSIVDLSSSGSQPMRSHCNRYFMVFNGEIYNHLRLRRELDKQFSPSWQSSSDTETILTAFACWGLQKTLNKVIGMFAIALWDSRERSLSLIRDRMGEKPLYYGWAGRSLLFGSELKALRQHSEWQAEINRDAIACQLRLCYIPAPLTIYQDIYKLEPGHLLTIRADTMPGTRLPTHAYWSADNPTGINNTGDLSHLNAHQLTDELEALLMDAVGQQMLADVPLGAFLSGGVDSSLIVALMQAQSERPVQTFTIGYEEKSFNEAPFARDIARYLGTNHTECIVRPSDALDVIPKLPVIYDEPFSDMSQIPTYLVAQLAQRKVKVSLSGDGADELFGGYNRYFHTQQIWRKLQLLPLSVRRLLGASLTRLSVRQWDSLFRLFSPLIPQRLSVSEAGEKIFKLSEVLQAENPEAIYRRLVSHWKQPEEVVIGTQHVFDPVSANFAETVSFPERMMRMDATGYLPGDILTKVDRAAMSVGLETRAPFLDHRVVEFAWQLPLEMKIRNGEGKWLQKEVLYRHIPKELLDRPKKGFGVPLDNWLRTSLQDWAESLLDPSRLRQEGFFNPEPILKKWQQHKSGAHNWQYYLWDVLMFQAWHEHEKQADTTLYPIALSA